MLKVGDKAPDFSATIQTGETVSLQDYRGQKLILFIYPASGTPSCTVENCSLRDGYAELKAKGYALLGVSPDSVKKQYNFIQKQNLPFSLIADTDNQVIKLFGAWGEKQMYGKTYDGVLRSTFIINEEGIIERVIDKVVTKTHAQQILGGE
ncbi:thioredoxin-dependent thiol peroxidase [Haliscomenobacter hydrossis]|uniref:thioredoxin-dependent peroxiredoxin n=1 Tax=Haliscomenobacter hydrossis (strain ATCC 27775 / DSM 1100 / LMG 10767 / O) TaxID=760192 RepID=F4L6N6_HALH1|nr:thioredoxin-dependent thiol peroxidase [Haliscomenobacter hydrossis]AEE50867.1 alkyl hydroperoxide reductase/ Thiol specific antioxidant/ Mal allergen [Haliscomenobacter hydrossis DSM 1100]